MRKAPPSSALILSPLAASARRHCGAGGLTKSEQLAHGRKHARERSQPVAAD